MRDRGGKVGSWSRIMDTEEFRQRKGKRQESWLKAEEIEQ